MRLDTKFCDLMLSDDERRDGAIIVHIFGAIYFFALLAVVCHDYFLPSVECICEDLNMSKVTHNKFKHLRVKIIFFFFIKLCRM